LKKENLGPYLTSTFLKQCTSANLVLQHAIWQKRQDDSYIALVEGP